MHRGGCPLRRPGILPPTSAAYAASTAAAAAAREPPAVEAAKADSAARILPVVLPSEAMHLRQGCSLDRVQVQRSVVLHRRGCIGLPAPPPLSSSAAESARTRTRTRMIPPPSSQSRGHRIHRSRRLEKSGAGGQCKAGQLTRRPADEAGRPHLPGPRGGLPCPGHVQAA